MRREACEEYVDAHGETYSGDDNCWSEDKHQVRLRGTPEYLSGVSWSRNVSAPSAASKLPRTVPSISDPDIKGIDVYAQASLATCRS